MSKPESPSRQFEMQIEIAAPRDRVWQAIASDEGLRRWFAPDSEITPEVGGEVVWKWGDAYHWVQRIEICEPGVRLKSRYDSSVDDGSDGKKPLFIDFLLEGEGGSTSLRLVHSGFGPEADFDGEFDGISGGWPVELSSLRNYLERHEGEDRQVVWGVAPLEGDPDEKWKLLTGPRGMNCGSSVDTMKEGESFRFTTVDGDLFEGTVASTHKRAFTGVVSNRGHAFLKVNMESSCGVWLWLGAYGRPESEISGLQTRFDSMLEGLFSSARAESAVEEGA